MAWDPVLGKGIIIAFCPEVWPRKEVQKVKRFFPSSLALLMFFAVLTLEMRAQDFYPLDSANTWSYRIFYNHWPLPEDSASMQLGVATDTLMPNGRVYRRLTHPDILYGQFVRVDSAYVYYYAPWDSADHAMYNLRAAPGTTDTIRWMNGALGWSRFNVAYTGIVFGHSRTMRHYSFDGIIQFEVTLADGFGIVEALDKGDGIWPYYARWSIRGCIIRDTLYGTLVSVPREEMQPTEFRLFQNYPNPFNPSTRIEFDLVAAGPVRLAVTDLLGREVATVVDGFMSSGKHEIAFDASHLATGVYVYVLSTPGGSLRRKMMLLK
ncbi:MAG: hypothetical protein HW407_1604 [Bacteroidetes bacterium]|nr:hypothetical protein [Bacteroidota bacterium]